MSDLVSNELDVLAAENFAMERRLREAGVAEIFGPGTNVLEAAFSVLGQIEGRVGNR